MFKKLISVVLLFLKISYFAFSQIEFNSPLVINNPENYYKYSSDSRQFTGIPSIAVTPNGRMWATWYAGITPGEDSNNYVVISTSSDNGKIWEEVLVVDPDGRGPVRAYDPEAWIDPNGKLWIFWAQNIKHQKNTESVWFIKADDPENNNTNWSSPQRITDGVMMCKPTVLSNNEWLLPISTWRYTDNSAKVYATKDYGQTWSLRGSVNIPKQDREYDEHMVVELNNSSLWMLVRTNYGIGESFSDDKGKTWSNLSSSSIEHPSSRFFISKLQSGSLLLVKHGPIAVKTGRSHLMAFISQDDGKTWSAGLLLDERLGISYPDGQQTADGKIHLVYDFDRKGSQHIIYTYFTEDEILSTHKDEMIYKVFKRRTLISKGGK